MQCLSRVELKKYICMLRGYEDFKKHFEVYITTVYIVLSLTAGEMLISLFRFPKSFQIFFFSYSFLFIDQSH